MNWYIEVKDVVEEIGGATRQNPKNLSHHKSWWGWREGGKIFLRTDSGAAKRQSEWNFYPPQEGRVIFHNSTRNAYCALRIPPGCPLMRILYEKNLSYKILHQHIVGEQVEVVGYRQNLHCYWTMDASHVPISPWGMSQVKTWDWEQSNHWWGHRWSMLTTGPWLVVAEEFADHNGVVSSSVKAIHVWAEPMYMSDTDLLGISKAIELALDEKMPLPKMEI